MEMGYGSLIISSFALFVSALSYYFSIKSWKETYRPIVTARVTTKKSNEKGTGLDIIVENTGNRPAKNIRFIANEKELESVLLAKKGDPLREDIDNIFSKDTIIPVIANNRFITNGFGLLTDNDETTWRVNSILNIEIIYQGLDGRSFSDKMPLLLADDTGFAGGYWG
jgi:hypothetical protein